MLDPIAEPDLVQSSRPIGRSIGRFLTALAIGMVVVPLGLAGVYPVERFPAVSRCGDTIENYTLVLGLAMLGARFAWKILKAINEVSERHLTRIDAAARHRYLARQAATVHKPSPLDDF